MTCRRAPRAHPGEGQAGGPVDVGTDALAGPTGRPRGKSRCRSRPPAAPTPPLSPPATLPSCGRTDLGDRPGRQRADRAPDAARSHHAAATEILLIAAPGSMLVHPLTLAACSSAVDGSDAARRRVMTCSCRHPVAAPDAASRCSLPSDVSAPAPQAAQLVRCSTSPSSLATFGDALPRERGGAELPCCRDLSGRPGTAGVAGSCCRRVGLA